MKRSRWLLFSVITATAFALRVVHIWMMSDNPLFERPIMDAMVHDRWARGLLDGSWPGADPFFRAPLYPYLLGALYAIFDAARFPVQIVHALISAAGAGLAALVSRRFFGLRAGYLSGALLATLWTSIYFSAELLIVTLPVTLNLLAVWILVDRPDGAPGRRRILLAGLAIGLSAIARPNILITIPVVGWYLWRSTSGRGRYAAWALFALGAALPIAPVTTHNLVRGGDAVLIASQGGVNFYIGNNVDSDGRTAIVPGTRATWQGGYEDAIAMAEEDAGHSLKPSGVDRYFLRRGLSYFVESPLDAAALYWKKLRMLLGAPERSNNKFIYAWRDWSPLLSLWIWPGWAAVLALGILGLGRRDWPPAGRGLMIGLAATYAVSILLFFVNARFRLPIAAFLAVPAGAGLDALWTAFRSGNPLKGWRHGLVGPLVAVVILGVSLSDYRGFNEHRTEANPFNYFTLANAYADQGERARAVETYARALEINRRYPQSGFAYIRESLYSSYVELLVGMGRPVEALSVARDWVRAAPDTQRGRLWLANLLMDAREFEEAAAHFEIALRTDPEDPDAIKGSAWILYQNGEYGKALRRFQSLNRTSVDNRSTLGEGLCLLALNRLDEAERCFLDILDRDPSFWQALGNLGHIYEAQGREAQATTVYRRLLKIRPDDPRAKQWVSSH